MKALNHSISHRTFNQLVLFLSFHPIFKLTRRKLQQLVQFQLASYLLRFGWRGSDLLDVAHKMGLDFGMVYLYCRQIICVLREMELFVCSWGDNERHAQSKAIFSQNRFHNCIGVVNGSLIQLAVQPAEDGNLYICCKKYPAVCYLLYISPHKSLQMHTDQCSSCCWCLQEVYILWVGLAQLSLRYLHLKEVTPMGPLALVFWTWQILAGWQEYSFVKQVQCIC